MKKNKKYLLPVFVILFVPFVSLSQVSQGGTPYSFDYKTKDLITQEVPVILMPEIDIDKLHAEDMINDKRIDIPWRFGENIDVGINRKSHGIEDILSDGSKLWRVSIYSPGALSINLLFDNYRIPPGASLFIYNEKRNHILGAFTDFNNREDGYFATDLVYGNNITIEYYEPANAVFSGELNISRITHGYRSFDTNITKLNHSGACNVNVACPEAEGWEEQVRSACLIIRGGGGICSGALINNTANDGTPYLLSAAHCYADPATTVFRFNYQSPTCNNPTTNPSYQSISGCTSIAGNSASDFWLVRLSSAPPLDYNVHYSGWNRTFDYSIPGTVVGIHHPKGDIKKFSWSNGGVVSTNYGGNAGSGTTYWKVGSWTGGTVEPGSSGSPLFDSNKRIIGQLTGAYSECGNTEPAWYGRFTASWLGGGTPNSRLRDWLDPINSGQIVLDGFDPISAPNAKMEEIVVPQDLYCNISSMSPEVVISNVGNIPITSATISYTLNNEEPFTIEWTGNLESSQTETIVFPEIEITEGSHTFVATVSNPNGESDINPENTQITKNFDIYYYDISIPFFEDFETSTFDCWTLEYVNESNPWELYNGGISNNPPSAYSGTKNALFKIYNYTTPVTKLITPELDLSELSNPILSFMHAMTEWSDRQDELRVYYKNNPDGNWNLLETYLENTPTWTQRTISLPEPTSTYWVAFEGKSNFAFGVCIDDVLIKEEGVIIEQNEINSEINIFPNPNDGAFTINFNNADHAYETFTISDITGKIIRVENIPNNNNSLIIDNLNIAAGIYTVTFSSQKGNLVKKLVVQ